MFGIFALPARSVIAMRFTLLTNNGDYSMRLTEACLSCRSIVAVAMTVTLINHIHVMASSTRVRSPRLIGSTGCT